MLISFPRLKTAADFKGFVEGHYGLPEVAERGRLWGICRSAQLIRADYFGRDDR